MSFIAGILTVLLLLNCVLLIFLVLIQLPKKDAGAGIAFGGGAADALFGAGSGNVLTKITKWAAGIFFAMALILGIVEAGANRKNGASAFENAVNRQQAQMPVSVPPGTPPPTSAVTNSATMPAVPVNPPPAPAPMATGSNAPAK